MRETKRGSSATRTAAWYRAAREAQCSTTQRKSLGSGAVPSARSRSVTFFGQPARAPSGVGRAAIRLSTTTAVKLCPIALRIGPRQALSARLCSSRGQNGAASDT